MRSRYTRAVIAFFRGVTRPTPLRLRDRQPIGALQTTETDTNDDDDDDDYERDGQGATCTSGPAFGAHLCKKLTPGLPKHKILIYP